MGSLLSRIAFVFALCIVGAVSIWLVLALRGDLDSGKFEIKQSKRAAPNRVAILAKRSDHTALSGDTYFVLIGDHTYSAPELRKALYSSQVVFEVGRNGLSLDWTSPQELVISCLQCGITSDRIQKQKFSYKEITIRYQGFP